MLILLQSITYELVLCVYVRQQSVGVESMCMIMGAVHLLFVSRARNV
jgi:hypothetical protein